MNKCNLNAKALFLDVPMVFHDLLTSKLLNVSGSCLTILRCLDYINIDISILPTGV